jgi:hypothetical protein
MRRTVAVSAVLIAVTAVLGATDGPRQKTLPFCADAGDKPAPAVLMPVDEAIRMPDFFTYRARLQMAVAAHDTDAVLSMVDPNIKLGFGGDDGLRRLREKLTGAEAPEYWRSLGRILALGGAFKSASSFEAPYVFSNWPERTDAFECGAVTGAHVAVRKEGRPDAAILTRTSYAIVRLGGETSANKGWSMVHLSTGQKGYIHTDFLWGSTALRAVFNLIGGQWRMTGLVSGD